MLVTTAEAVVYLLVAVLAGVVVVLKVEVQPYQPEEVVLLVGAPETELEPVAEEVRVDEAEVADDADVVDEEDEEQLEPFWTENWVESRRPLVTCVEGGVGAHGMVW